MLDVSVIIVNWNTRDFLRQCLASVFAETNGISFEVTVIDNGSTDGSAGMVAREFPQVVLIGNAGNRGFAAANNQGMRQARGRYILLLNSDTVILDGAVQKAVTYADEESDAAVVGCRAWGTDGRQQANCHRFPSVRRLLLVATGIEWVWGRARGRGSTAPDGSEGARRVVDWLAGCFMLVRRQAIEQVGLMDEGFFMYAEETDWCYRFRRKGWKVLYFPGAEIVHHGGGSTDRSERDMLTEERISLLRYFRKHHGAGVALVANFLFTVRDAIRIGAWSLAWAFQKVAGSDGTRWLSRVRASLRTLKYHTAGAGTRGSQAR